MLLAWAAITMALTTASPPRDDPHVARVAADSVEVLDEPDDAAFSTGRLARGRRVVVRREGPDGWVAIEPPEGSYSLVEGSDLEDLGDGRARVIVRFASVRPGRDGAKVPGPPRVSLRQGTVVRLLDRRPLVIRRNGDRESWVAIRPPRSESRFVRAETLEDWPEGDVDPDETPRRNGLASARSEVPDADPPPQKDHARPSLGPIDPDFATAGPDTELNGLPAESRREVARVAAKHRSALKAPIERWELTTIAAEYEAILKGGIDVEASRIVEARLARVRRQIKAATAARRLSDLVRSSKARDGLNPGPAAGPDLPGRGDYDATGLLQASSRMVDGRKIFALLGDDGDTVAYLAMPLGLSASSYLSRRVGVRGDARFDESLQAKLIRVKDLEVLTSRR